MCYVRFLFVSQIVWQGLLTNAERYNQLLANKNEGVDIKGVQQCQYPWGSLFLTYIKNSFMPVDK